ncbi:P-loop containing nucleoside triphosphate hydrolase [Vibrio phage 1.170.O._10N.261.52.C3]|nr:P-loop containing nucleoside triphosphate hydrolase [Vibrio phage 1.170.O._10N.261.52.C3]
MNRKVIGLSGSSPRSGKNTLAKHLQGLLGEDRCQILEFKDKLIQMTAAFLGISVEEFIEGYDNKAVDYLKNMGREQLIFGDISDVWWKDVPLYSVNGRDLSKREALIHVSENCVKPFCGNSFFGEATAKDMTHEIVIVADSGFADECRPVIKSCRSPADVLVVRIKSDRGEGIADSREMLHSDMFDWFEQPQFITVENNKDTDLKEFLDNATVRIMDFLEE